jgi:HEAT repeat protein
MHNKLCARYARKLLLASAVVAIGLCRLVAIWAQPVPSDPVEELRQVLKSPVHDPAERERNLQRPLEALHSLNDVQRALALREWRNQDPESAIAAVDQRQRDVLIKQFERATRDVLQHGNTASRLAVLHLLIETAGNAGNVGNQAEVARRFGPDLADLTKRGNPGTRAAAARALGQIDPDPDVAVPALSSLLGSKEAWLRLAVAEALVSWMRLTLQLATLAPGPISTGAAHGDVVKVGSAVVPLAGRALADRQAKVRREGARALALAAETLHKALLPSRPSLDIDGDQQADEERGRMLPLLQSLKNQSPVLTRALADSDAEVRLLARQTLEDMTDPQMRVIEPMPRDSAADAKPGSRPAKPVQLTSSAKDSPVEGQRATVMALAAGVKDPDVRARRAAIDVLENLGPAARPAALALVDALADSDKFVRWAAARTLGKIGPVEKEKAVPALTRLLGDSDLDLRLAAAVALRSYGRAAKPAVQDLIRAVKSGDPELRVAAMQTLQTIGSPGAEAAIPALIAVLAYGDPRVRQTAAEALGKLGPLAREAETALRKALQDSNPEVQRKAGEALLKIMGPSQGPGDLRPMK